MPLESYLPEWEDLWAKSEMDTERFFALAVEAGRMSIEDYERESELSNFEANTAQFLLNKTFVIPTLEEHAELLGITEGYKEAPADTVASKLTEYLRTAFRETLSSLWQWTLNNLKSMIDLIVNSVTPILQNAWESAKGKMEEWALELYKQLDRACEEYSPIKPEDAGPLAAKLYLLAMTAGMGAHGISLVTELLHPLKTMGIHQTAALVGDFAQFGRIGAAISGPLIQGVLQKVIQYATNNKFRPTIPNDRMLQIMAVKPDITLEQFRQGMAYCGYSDNWIEAIEATMYHEPRYFELKMMSEDEAADEEWLFTKSRRAGFSEDDARIMVSSYLKAATRDQRKDYYKQAWNHYKEGYISLSDFESILTELQIRPEARRFAIKAADYAYRYDHLSEMISYYKTSFRNDLIDEDELLVNLVAMSIPPIKSSLIVETEKARKKPAQIAAPTPAAKKPLAEIQSKYIQLYREQFKRDLINSAVYLNNLLALGLDPDLAHATVALEMTKALPT